MANEAGVPPLPRRVPGASDSPKPAVRIDLSAIPEDLRQRVLTAIAHELKRDEAERRAAQERAGGVSPESRIGAGLAHGGGVGLANGNASPGTDGAPGYGEVTPPGRPESWPPVPLPRRDPGTNGAPQPPAEVRREFLPPSMFGRRLDAEAHTEPFPRIPGLHPDVPAAADRPGSAGPPATPAFAAGPAVAGDAEPADAAPAKTVPPDPVRPPAPLTDIALASAPTATVPAPGWAAPEQRGTPGLTAAPGLTAPPDLAARRAAALPKAGRKPGRSARRWRMFGLLVAVAALIVVALLALGLHV